MTVLQATICPLLMPAGNSRAVKLPAQKNGRKKSTGFNMSLLCAVENKTF